MKLLIAVLLFVGVTLGALSPAFGYRDLEAGVFITRDPAGFVDGPNLYSYVRQNPWTMWDPWGLSPYQAAQYNSAGITGQAYDPLKSTRAFAGHVSNSPELQAAGRFAVKVVFIVDMLVLNLVAYSDSAYAKESGTEEPGPEESEPEVNTPRENAETSYGDDGKPEPEPKRAQDYDPQVPGQQLEELTEAQDRAVADRPSIQEEGDDWEGAPKRPKQHEIEGAGRSRQRDNVELYEDDDLYDDGDMTPFYEPQPGDPDYEED